VTRYHRLEPIEKSLFNHIMRAYVDTTIRKLEKGYFDRIAEICRRVVCEVR